ncbi:MAG: hypothetical protein IKV48_07910 [Eggerthellaceae bacterium]|nr:hypothetical protein [Eggerthellaceae bacterium]
MKKILAFVLALPLALSLFACSGGSEGGSDAGADAAYADSLSIMNAVWEALPEGAVFAAMGGDAENAVMDEPGVHSLDAVDSLNSLFAIPLDLVASIDDAATVMHAMNSNTLTAIACHFVDGTDMDAAVSAIQTEIEGKQWMCGCPDKYVIAEVPGNYLVLVYGVNDVAGPFIDAMTANVAGCEIVVDAPLA